MPKKGLFINIEGTDGSGKATQAKLLSVALRRQGHKVFNISFPRHGEPSARLVDDYLTGKFGLSKKVSPYLASLFYAVDRLAAAPVINKHLAKGYTVIADRYTLSNAAHQGGKLSSLSARRQFWQWLFNLEYKILQIPRPDLSLLLYMPSAVAQSLVGKKKQRGYLNGAKHDIHEADLGHLQAAAKAYLKLASLYKIAVVKCFKNRKLLSKQEINKEILKIVKQKSER
ncbi:MAG: thymidylate kinase [Candidatus Kerfeldbacteria bacterium]|nr:thymidylate kinase [Candidatus Kerfeldbacteria bacterium]